MNRVFSSAYLALAVVIFASSNSVTRRLIDIGGNNLVEGRNPISPCNVLFVGNICAFGLMVFVFYKHWSLHNLRALTRKDWIGLTFTSVLSGAIVPWLIFTALEQTNVTNVVLIGRIEPIVTLILSVWLLKTKINYWTVAGCLILFAGSVLTAFLNVSSNQSMFKLHLGNGEIFVAIAAVIVAISTVVSKLQLRSIPIGIIALYRNFVGTWIFFVLANLLYGAEHLADVLSPFLWKWMILYAAVIVVLGQLCWLVGLKKASATELNVASLLNPIIAIVMAYLLLGEVPTYAQYWGGSLLLLGVTLSSIGALRQSKSGKQLNKLDVHDAMDINIGFKGI